MKNLVLFVLMLDIDYRSQKPCAKHDNKHWFYFSFIVVSKKIKIIILGAYLLLHITSDSLAANS